MPDVTIESYGPFSFPLFSNFLGPNFEQVAYSSTSFAYFHFVSGYGGSVAVRGEDFVYDANGYPVSGTVTGIQFTTEDGMFPFPRGIVADLNLPVQQVTQALEDTWTLTGSDQFAGVAAWFTGRLLIFNYPNSSGVTLADSIYQYLDPNQEVLYYASVYDDALEAFDVGTTIHARGGDDLIQGRDGDDRIYGGNGDDTVNASGGADGVLGGAGNDLLRGGDGDDRMLGGTGFDLLVGGTGDDVLAGGAQADNIRGGTGNDTLNGDAGFDRLFGGWAMTI